MCTYPDHHEAHPDFDAVAEQEHANELLKGKLKATGRPVGVKGTPGVPSEGGTDRRSRSARRPPPRPRRGGPLWQ
jgi:hypothetical protein